MLFRSDLVQGNTVVNNGTDNEFRFLSCTRPRLIVKLLRRDRVSNDHVCIALVAWLFNPFTMAISTRGSGESLVVVQLLTTLLFLRQGMDIWETIVCNSLFCEILHLSFLSSL
jgi:hypothetical protein